MAEQGKSRQQIESDLTAARTRLSANLESLIDQVHPTKVKERQIAGVKTLVSGEVNNVKAQFTTPSGEWRTDRLVLIGGSIVGAVVLLVTLSALSKRRKRG